MVNTLFDKLNDSSLFAFLVPFLLVFAIIYGILSKIDLFTREDDKGKGKRINLGISIVIGLIFASVSLATDCLSAVFPKLAVTIIILLIFYMLMGFVMNREENKNLFNIVLGILAVAGFIIIIFMSTEACGITIGSINWMVGSWLNWVVGIIIVGGLIMWMLKGSGTEDDKKEGKKEEDKKKSKKEEPKEKKESETEVPYGSEAPYGL